MKCPACRQIENDIVIDSRGSRDGTAIRRRRKCGTCNHRWTTWERYGDISVALVKAKRVADDLRTMANRLEVLL